MSESLLNHILSPGGLNLVFQPIVSVTTTTRTLSGVECLTRGPHGTLFERPDLLFDYVRRKKAEVTVDRAVFALALTEGAKLPDPIRISINVHASTLGRDPDYAHFVSRLIRNVSVDATRIMIEIVEHAPVWHQDQFLANISALKEQGIRIALDDFGLGHSNYRMILDTAPDCFKLDSFLVKEVASDNRRQAAIVSLVNLARDLGASLVAEGIEHEQELEILLKLGVRQMQGFLFARPLPFDQLFASTVDFAKPLYL